MRNRIPREIRERHQCKEHQSDKEEGGETHDAVNHLALGNQVHEIARDQRRLTDRNKKRHRDVDFPVAKRDVSVRIH